MTILSWTESVEDEYEGYDLTNLGIDRHYLTVINNSTQIKYLYTLSKECLGCPYLLYSSIYPERQNTFTFKTNQLYRIFDENSGPSMQNETSFCDINYNFGEFGIYTLSLSDTDCQLEEIKEAVDIYFPLLTVALILLTICCVLGTARYFYKKCLTKLYPDKPNNVDDSLEKKKERIQSLDTFRGISIVLMIFVNYGAGQYEIFDHAKWNGLHIADIVFPFFLWIMGVCIPISVSSMFKRGQSKATSLKQILKRSVKLFAIGIFLNSGKYLEYLRIFGVLQRFGICYFFVASLCVIFYKEGQKKSNFKDPLLFHDLRKLLKEWIVIILVLVAHCLITFLVAEEGCPKGYLGPGGYHENGKYFNCSGGAAGYIDRLILGKHIYLTPTYSLVYNSPPFDPEGILGCLTSIFHTFLGVQAGAILQTYQNKYARISCWLLWGLVIGVIGATLCGFSKEDGLIPVNKNLWSVSFVLVTTSMAFFLLSILYYVIDVKKWWSGKPFMVAGMNSIFLYIGHSLIGSQFPVHWGLVEARETHFLQTLENVWATNAWIMVAYYLYRIKFFLSI